MPRIRLSIPFWGKQYAERVVGLTIPALLAPGNIPALAEKFGVEVSLVTQSALFDLVSQSRAFRQLEQVATVRLVSLDDLITGVAGDYGPVLTFALIRGYEDLGERMLDYYLMFLNADFIVADGSYRTVARLIEEGHQVIHSPSFRGIYEEVVPALQRRISADRPVLAVQSRELVALALRHKHVTVKARIINQRLCHQWRMDQFYWYVDETTLIGYQWPIALVALKPQRVMTKPKLMFDYGFIPEICPTAPKYYISDSDDFFMLEPQRRTTGRDLVQLGWISPEAIAKDLSLWTTREHRECGQQMHVFHSADLPADMSAVVAESRQYVADVVARLEPPNPHDKHPLFHSWWTGALQRMEARRTSVALVDGSEAAAALAAPTPDAAHSSRLLSLARRGYRSMFGQLPEIKPSHPLWLETHRLAEAFKGEKSAGARILWVSNPEMPLFRLAESADVRLAPEELLHDPLALGQSPTPTYDACIFDLSVAECMSFRKLYEAVRPWMRHEAKVYLNVVNSQWRQIPANDLEFCDALLPDNDSSDAVFAGGQGVRVLRNFFFFYAKNWPLSHVGRYIAIAGFLVGLAPIMHLVNRRASTDASANYRSRWFLMFARFVVIRAGARRSPARKSALETPDPVSAR